MAEKMEFPAGTTPSGVAGRHIVLGLSGGIACYKAAEFCRALIKAGATVQVVMTPSAAEFITPVTMQALSGRAVFISQWDDRTAGGVDNNMAHINLSREADAIVVAPASADFMAKLLHGRADELLSLMCLARPIERVPLILAPAMNREMWTHPATQRNVAQLRADGAHVLGVDAGAQACGEVGDGRMLEPDALLEAVDAFFYDKSLAGRHVLITAGPTVEAIDPVRVLTNRSSGKMGFALASAAARAGARVTLVTGPVALATPSGVQRVDVSSAARHVRCRAGGCARCPCVHCLRRRSGLDAGDAGSPKIEKGRVWRAPSPALCGDRGYFGDRGSERACAER